MAAIIFLRTGTGTYIRDTGAASSYTIRIAAFTVLALIPFSINNA